VINYQAIQSILLTIVIVGFLVYRQIRPRRLSSRGLILMPIIVVYFIVQALPTFHPTPTRLVEMGVTAAVSIVFGLLACRQLKVYASDKTGKAMASGSWEYFLWWLGAFAVKAILSVIFGETDLSKVSEVDILVPVLLLVVTRNVYLYLRVNKLGLELHTRQD
jgi:hypothetical protein